jgi:hypothetical protein
MTQGTMRVEVRPLQGIWPDRRKKMEDTGEKSLTLRLDSLPYFHPQRCREYGYRWRHCRASEAALAGNPR